MTKRQRYILFNINNYNMAAPSCRDSTSSTRVQRHCMLYKQANMFTVCLLPLDDDVDALRSIRVLRVI